VVKVKVEKISFKSEGETILGDLHIPNIKNPPVIIMCHGLGGSRGGIYSDHAVKIADKFCKNGFAVLRFSFRGHDEDSENGIKLTFSRAVKDTISAIDFVEKQNFDSDKICLNGRSFGGMIAIIVASQDKRIKVLSAWATLISPSFLDKKKVKRQLKNLGYYKYRKWMNLDKQFFDDFEKYDILECVKKIKIPFLIAHGEKDCDIDISNAKKIYKNINEPKELIIAKDVDHRTETFINEITDKTIDWFKKWLK